MECEICSKKAVGKALIEGAEVFVCESCSRGKFIERFPEPTKLPSKVKEEEEPQLIRNLAISSSKAVVLFS